MLFHYSPIEDQQIFNQRLVNKKKQLKLFFKRKLMLNTSVIRSIKRKNKNLKIN